MRITCRSFITLLAALAVASAAAARSTDEPCVPVSGELHADHAGLAEFDAIVLDVMCEHGVTAVVAAVSKDGEIVLERGYGWLDEKRTAPLPPDALMRIASISKPITAAAVRALVEDGKLSLDDKAFDVDGNGGVLRIEPFPQLGDERLRDVTIEHLLHHRGGWDRSKAGDLTYREAVIAKAMSVPSPPGRENTMGYILGRPLEFTPGEGSAYSNIGYLALGLIVEQVSGMNLIDFIHERVLSPLGVARAEHQAGRTFRKDCNPREPHYDCESESVNVFDPDGPRVKRPYGGWDHEARIGQGGQITTARTLLKFLHAHFISGPAIGSKRNGNEGRNWRRNHGGTLWGTNAIARQRGDGVCYVIIFNKRPVGEQRFAAAVMQRFDAVLDDGGIEWAKPEGQAGLRH